MPDPATGPQRRRWTAAGACIHRAAQLQTEQATQRFGAVDLGAVGPGPVCVRALLLGAILLTAPSLALAQNLAVVGRNLTALEGDTRVLVSQPLVRDPARSPTFVEERLTDGELFYRLGDFNRANIFFTDIVEHHRGHRAFSDALFLLADSMFHARDYLGARRRFSELLDRGSEAAFRPYVQRSLGRLIEIAIHTADFEGVETYFERLNRLPPAEVDAGTNYFRGKYLYSRALHMGSRQHVREQAVSTAAENGGGHEMPGDVDPLLLDQAQQMFAQVTPTSAYGLQAQYFVGVIHTLRGRYPEAIEAFRRILRAPSRMEESTGGESTESAPPAEGTADGEPLATLAQLALGRLYYETDRLSQAVEAYQSVSRRSPLFDQALYELAWVFIRMGDSTRAERALEVLAIASPDSPHIPDGQLLRGNLLLRDGRYQESEEVFRTVRSEFGPLHRELEERMNAHGDPRAYFRNLVRANIETFDASNFLPPLAQAWADREGSMGRVLGVLGDLNAARTLVRETSELADRLNAALGARNAVNVFADLRRQREKTISLRNRLVGLRSKLLAIESRTTGAGNGELQQVRQERRQLETLFGGMPTEGADFEVRNDQLLGRYRGLERQLNQLQVELMGVDARIVATERFMKDSAVPGADLSAVSVELAEQRRAAAGFRDTIAELERDIERAKLQVGVGDARYEHDEDVRRRYESLVEREHSLMASLGIVRSRELDLLFGRTAELASLLDRRDAEIDAIVASRRTAMLAVVEEETRNLAGYRNALAALDGEAEDTIGTIAYLNFDAVRNRFLNLVRRADVGIIDVSWATREEHRMRVDMLTRERSREVQALDDEFREIMDLQSSDTEDEP